MTGEDMADSYQWESGEADWDSDEAFAGDRGEDIEDIGEASRRRRRAQNRYRPARGVHGIKLQRQDGGSQTVRFPAKLATTDETNRGLASQEMGRRELEEKLIRLEKQFGRQLKNDTKVTGIVTLGIGGGLTAYGAVKAAENADSSDKFRTWAREGATKMASVISATQLVTSGAKLVVDGHYQRNGIGLAADIFAVGQLTAFVVGTFSSPSTGSARVTIDYVEPDGMTAQNNLSEKRYQVGNVVMLDNNGDYLRVIQGSGGLQFERI